MKFSKKLQIVIEAMEKGRIIKLPTGHRLEWSEEHEAPGFWYETYNPSIPEDGPTEGIMQIGSEVAWMSLIDYAKTLSDADILLNFERIQA